MFVGLEFGNRRKPALVRPQRGDLPERRAKRILCVGRAVAPLGPGRTKCAKLSAVRLHRSRVLSRTRLARSLVRDNQSRDPACTDLNRHHPVRAVVHATALAVTRGTRRVRAPCVAGAALGVQHQPAPRTSNAAQKLELPVAHAARNDLAPTVGSLLCVKRALASNDVATGATAVVVANKRHGLERMPDPQQRVKNFNYDISVVLYVSALALATTRPALPADR